MSTNSSSLRTADALLAQLECTHIITMNNPNQNLHLERLANGLRFTAGSPGDVRHVFREFASLTSMTSVRDKLGGRQGYHRVIEME